MASYPTDSPLLSALDATIPIGAEDASLLVDAIRQTRYFLKTLLEGVMNDDGTLKDDAITLDAIADGLLSYAKIQNVSSTDRILGRSSAGAGVIQEIVCTSVARTFLAATDTAGQRTVLGLAALAIKTTIATADIDAKAVTDAKLANDAASDSLRAVGSDHIKNSAITASKILDACILPSKFASSGSAGKLYYDTGSAIVAATIGGDLSATYAAGELSFVLSGSAPAVSMAAAIISEKASSTGNGGTCVAATFSTRPVSDSDAVLAIDSDPGNLVDLSGADKVKILNDGTYLISLLAVGYSCGIHKARLTNTTTTSVILETATQAAPAGVSNAVQGWATVSLSANDLLQVSHYTELDKAVNGFGIKSGSGTDVNRYFILTIIKTTAE